MPLSAALLPLAGGYEGLNHRNDVGSLKDCVHTPGLDHVLCFAWRCDNAGVLLARGAACSGRCFICCRLPCSGLWLSCGRAPCLGRWRSCGRVQQLLQGCGAVRCFARRCGSAGAPYRRLRRWSAVGGRSSSIWLGAAAAEARVQPAEWAPGGRCSGKLHQGSASSPFPPLPCPPLLLHLLPFRPANGRLRH